MTTTIILSKVCSKCKIEKNITEYHKRTDRPSGVASHCKACEKQRKSNLSEEIKVYSKQYYEDNKDKVCARSGLKTKEKREYIRKLKDGKPCMDCGQSFPGRPEVMDFDHIDDNNKSFNIAAAAWQTYENIDAEIAKCELICANCHRTRTVKRGQPAKANAKLWTQKKESADKSALSVNDIISDIIS